jgi:hypothetical protein
MKLREIKRQFPLLAFTAMLATQLSGCAAIKAGSHYDETADFSALHTFTWAANDPYVAADSTIRISPLTEEKIQLAIRNQLDRAGFEYSDTPGSADMLIAFTVGTREKISVESYPINYPGTWGWHVRGSHYVVREVYEHRYTEGTLGVDIFDGKTNKPIWHGWAETVITEKDRQNPSQVVDDGVAKLFSSFPN